MSGVQVRGSIKARPDGKFDDRLAATIGERLIALEKANRGAADPFTAPELPSFGPGSPTGAPGAPGPPGPPGAPGVTDHGALTGLEDDDHPRYVEHLERMPPSPHVHTAEELGFDSRFYRRGERVPAIAHTHAHDTIAGIGSGDDHPQYQLRSEKGLAGGYPGMVSVGGVTFTTQTHLSSSGTGTFLKRNAGGAGQPSWQNLVGDDIAQASVVIAIRVFGG